MSPAPGQGLQDRVGPGLPCGETNAMGWSYNLPTQGQPQGKELQCQGARGSCQPNAPPVARHESLGQGARGPWAEVCGSGLVETLGQRPHVGCLLRPMAAPRTPQPGTGGSWPMGLHPAPTLGLGKRDLRLTWGGGMGQPPRPCGRQFHTQALLSAAALTPSPPRAREGRQSQALEPSHVGAETRSAGCPLGGHAVTGMQEPLQGG